ncbi:MAG: DUF2142 domain-containing protein [Lachnospiraceae bacterium]|nr:DUF2142 domain-containing protein [Lachnospiraceae bacterium]
MGKKEKKRIWGLGAIVIGWLLLCILLTPVYTTVTLTFAEDPSGEVITTIYAGARTNVSPSDARSRVVNGGIARISFLDIQYGSHCSLKRIDPVDQAYEAGDLTITHITVRQNGILTISLEGEELGNYFTGNEHVQFINETDFTFAVTGEDPQLLPNEQFQKLYAQRHWMVILAGALFFGVAGLLLFALLVWFGKEIQGEPFPRKIIFTVCLAGLIGAALLCVYTGLRSPFWLNPDEYDVRAAVNYYFTHFMPPDIRSDAINDSYPVYGTSRHFEWNLFYFYAGKLGQFFSDAAVRIRLFSLILFCVMVGIVIGKMRKHFCLLFVLLLTPQVWYIFSYSTSDALDYFVGFLSLYELIEENSMLNRLFREKFCRRHILYYGLLSILFIHLMWAKATFYPILLFLFLILLIRLLYQEKKERGPLLKKYLILVGLTLTIFVARYMITDFPYYGFNKLGVVIEVTEQHAEYGYKPSTPPIEQAYSMSFYGKGITLKELLTQYEFNKNLFRTFAGFFGSYAFGERDWYYLVMGLLYLILLGYLTYRFWRMKSRQRWWEYAASLFTCLIQYALIVFNSWFIDFQPQGRYLLPILFFFAFLISRVEKAREDKILQGILLCTCLLSLYAFWHVGIPNLVPQRVVLP